MGGHGGLNILPQKRWNVYNFDNREKVRRDEEAAAKEEQLKREQSRKRDTEFRIEQLRVARGLAPTIKAAEPDVSESKSGHINLFEGIKIFDPVKKSEIEGSFERDDGKRKKMKKEEVGSKSVPVSAEDEKYRLGYGVAGKGIKLPWYLEKPKDNPDAEKDKGDGSYGKVKDEGKKKEKRTVEELREERLKREKREKERERALMVEKKPRRSDIPASRDRGYSRRTLLHNCSLKQNPGLKQRASDVDT